MKVADEPRRVPVDRHESNGARPLLARSQERVLAWATLQEFAALLVKSSPFQAATQPFWVCGTLMMSEYKQLAQTLLGYTLHSNTLPELDLLGDFSSESLRIVQLISHPSRRELDLAKQVGQRQ